MISMWISLPSIFLIWSFGRRSIGNESRRMPWHWLPRITDDSPSHGQARCNWIFVLRTIRYPRFNSLSTVSMSAKTRRSGRRCWKSKRAVKRKERFSTRLSMNRRSSSIDWRDRFKWNNCSTTKERSPIDWQSKPWRIRSRLTPSSSFVSLISMTTLLPFISVFKAKQRWNKHETGKMFSSWPKTPDLEQSSHKSFSPISIRMVSIDRNLSRLRVKHFSLSSQWEPVSSIDDDSTAVAVHL